MAKTAEELYQERATRIRHAIQLKVPDRIPIVPDAQFFPFKYARITVEEGMYDYSKTYSAWKKTFTDFEWDGYFLPYTFSGRVFESLDYKPLRLPGRGVSPTSPYQFIEPGQVVAGCEVYPPMSTEDYDWFLDDPSDYLIRAHWPKIYGALEPFRNLPPIHNVVAYSIWDVGYTSNRRHARGVSCS